MDKLVTITLLYWTIFFGASVRCQEPTQPPLQSDVEIESERGQCEKYSSQCAVREDGVILIAGTGWWPRTGDLSWNIIQKDISTLLKKTGHSVYITVFDATEEEIRDARNNGIDLIIAAEVSEDMPYSDRLLRHQVYFPILKEFKNISVIIGYADDESLSDAALSMQDSYFPDASFVLFLTHIPEDTDKEALVIENHANSILEHARSAKFLISIGPRIYSHFRNKFRTITQTDFTPEHLQFIPAVDDKILNSGVSCPFVEGKIEILSFDFAAKSVSDCTKNSEIAALAIGKLANDTVAINRLVNRFEWKIRGLSQKIARECQDLLRIKTESPHVSVKAYPLSGDVIEKISNDFKQCHLHLFTPEQDPFGMITLLSSAAGVPTVITTHSGVADYLKQDMMEQYNMIVVGGFGIHDDPAKIAGKLKEKFAHFLGNQNSYEIFFENAKTLQNILTMSIREGFIDDSHKNLSTKFKEEVQAKLQERRFSKDGKISEGEHVNKAGTAHGNGDISLTEMGSLKIGLNTDTGTPLQEDIKNNISQELKSCDDLPRFEKFLRSFEIKCQLLFDQGLSVVVLCPNTATLDLLWGNYENGSLSQMIQTDVGTNVKLKSVGSGNLRLRTSIERWRYRQCKLGLDIARKDQERATERLFWTVTSGLCSFAVLISMSFWYMSRRRSLNKTGTTGDAQKSTTEVRESSSGDTISGAVSNGKDKPEDEFLPDTPTTDDSCSDSYDTASTGDTADIAQLNDAATQSDISSSDETAIGTSAVEGITDDVQKSTTVVTQSNNGDTTSGAVSNGKDKNEDEFAPSTPTTDNSSTQSDISSSDETAIGTSAVAGTTDDAQKSTTVVTQSNNGDTTSGAVSNGKDKTEDEFAPSTTTTDNCSSNREPQLIGTKRYIGERDTVYWRPGGSKWRVQVLGSKESGTEPGQFKFPRGLAWHGDQLVICDRENHRIQILDKNKVVIEIIRFDCQFKKEFRPWDVAISPDGHFFITDTGNNQIIICDQNKKIIQIIPQSADIKVRSITVMAAFIFVSDSKGKSLIKYNIKDGKLVARVSDQFSDPFSVMATSNNHLLVSDRDKHVIHVLDSDLNFLNSYRNYMLKDPRGLDVDSHGNIYICTREWSNGIVKLRSDGQLDCVLFQGVQYYPWFVAVNDDITTTIAITGLRKSSSMAWYRSEHQISVFSVS